MSKTGITIPKESRYVSMRLTKDKSVTLFYSPEKPKYEGSSV